MACGSHGEGAMHRTAWVATLIVAGLTLPASAADLDISKYTKVYRGPEGLEVTFVALKDKKGALIRVAGTDTEIDGVVMRYDVAPQGRGGSRYHTALHGERFGTFHARKDRGRSLRYFIFLPEAPMESIDVVYDEERSKALNSDDVLTAYLKSRNKASIKKLAAWNRPERVEKQNAYYDEEAEPMRKKCGAKIGVKIRWKSVTDDVLKKYSIYGYCSAPINALRRLCESAEYQKVVQSKVKSIDCRFGDKLHLELADGTLKFTTETEAPNQEDFAKAFLANEL